MAACLEPQKVFPVQALFGGIGSAQCIDEVNPGSLISSARMILLSSGLEKSKASRLDTTDNVKLPPKSKNSIL